jgi:aspartyl protease family protein
VAIGPIRLDQVDALVTKPGVLNESLLGMNFLRRLRSYEFSGEFLTLRS